jgi:hypothetical protein
MAKTRAQRRSKLQEKRIAKDIGGKVQAGSGSSWRAKGDVRKPLDLRVEAKFTTKDSYVLKHADLLKIQEEALLGGVEASVMQIEFVEQLGYSQKFAILDYAWFLELRSACGDADKAVYDGKKDTWASSMTLHKDELQAHLSGVSSVAYEWVCRLNFQDYYQRSPTRSYALIFWSRFQELREASNQ